MKPEFPGALPGFNREPARDGNSLGSILIELGRISNEDAGRIADFQKESGLGFCEAGLALGLLDHTDIDFALARQCDYPYLFDDGAARLSPELMAALHPFSAHAESLRTLRSRLILGQTCRKNGCRTLAVTGPQRGDGRSHLAANLAIVFAQLGERTLLIDADMRHPRLHEMFGLDNGHGLSSMLSGQHQHNPVRHMARFPNLSILTAGPCPPNPQELLGRSAFAKLLDSLETGFQVVLLDTPPGNDYADVQMIGVRAGGVIMAVRRHHTGLDEAKRMSDELARHGVPILGVVLNEF